ncbi:hypothetical protein B0H16DRAFT_1514261, partial [Mycena metata]
MASNPASTECIDCGKTHPPRTALIPSPFQSIIALEEIPTPSETAAIREFTRDTDAEIAWREQAIDRLLCEVAELRRCSEQHEFIIAPIRRVPPEILAAIFLQLAAIEAQNSRHSMDYSLYDGLVEKKYMARPLLHRAPLIFGEVSRAWRKISLSTPRLWSSISLRCGNKELQTNSALCAAWLKRAGSLPLSIRFSRPSIQEEPISHGVTRNYQDLLETILPYSNRWRFVHFENLPAPTYDIIDSLPLNSVPILESLSVEHLAGPRHTMLQDTPWAKLKIAPKLTHLSFAKIRAANIVVHRESPTFPFSQLTQIEVGDCSADQCLEILGQALSAVACKFTVTETSAESSQHQPIIHPRLHTLKLDVYTNLHSLWSHLTCSVLSTLSVDTNSQGSPFFQGFPDFIARSGSHIKDFTLSGSTLNDHQFMACLDDMPQLRHLEVSEHNNGRQFTNHVWDSLTSAAGENSSLPLIPHLESLELTGAQESSHKSMVRMLKSRLRTATSPEGLFPFKKLNLSFFRNVSESAYDRLMAFEKLGIEIAIDVYPDDDGAPGSEASDSEEEDEGDESEEDD